MNIQATKADCIEERKASVTATAFHTQHSKMVRRIKFCQFQNPFIKITVNDKKVT